MVRRVAYQKYHPQSEIFGADIHPESAISAVPILLQFILPSHSTFAIHPSPQGGSAVLLRRPARAGAFSDYAERGLRRHPALQTR